MRVSLQVPGDRRSIVSALEGLTRLDQRIIRAHPEVPTVYAAGVRWTAEDGTENWRSIADVLGFDPNVSGNRAVSRPTGPTDCEDVAAWRCADLREREGELAAFVDVVPGGLGMWHAVVRRADGSVEDVSSRLGMPGRSAEEIGAMAATIEWEVRRTSNGWAGSLTVPEIRIGRDADGSVTVRATGSTPSEAMTRAAALAGLSLAHPALQGMMPAGSASKIVAVGRIARIGRRRPKVLGAVARRLSPGLRALALGLCS